MKFKSAHHVLLHPLVTEKTMGHMTERNSLEFLVRREANKPQIKQAVEELFGNKVEVVRTRMTKDGKRAVVQFIEQGAAEEVGMRIGVF
jgi:large subunit ribosomal protein L23